ESLTNVTRHAPRARVVTVSVDEGPDGVAVEVSDDAPHDVRHAVGHRPDGPGPGDGYGLVGMRERVEALGGTVHAGPGPDQGWTVRAVLPRRPAPASGEQARRVVP